MTLRLFVLLMLAESYRRAFTALPLPGEVRGLVEAGLIYLAALAWSADVEAARRQAGHGGPQS